jgi:hypothetical protein
MATIDLTRVTDGSNYGETELNTLCDELETFFNTTKISDDNIQDGTINGTKIAAGTVTAAKLASNSVGTDQLANDSVTAAKLNSDVAGDGLGQAGDGSITLNVDDSTIEISSDVTRLKDSGITTAKLSSTAANNDTLNAGAVTEDQLDPSPNIATNSTTGTSLSQAITLTTGRVLVVASYNEAILDAANVLSTEVVLKEGATTLASTENSLAGDFRSGGSFMLLRSPGSGSTTYTIESTGSQALAIQLIEI